MSRRVRQLNLKECYEILHLEKGASLEDLKRAYRKRAFELHPDLNPGNPAAARDFQLLNEAYVALSSVLKPKAETEQKQQKQQKEQKQQTSTKTASDAAGEYAKQQAKAGESAGQQSASQTRESAQPGPSTEQDVLRDLLNDPFARRVFEDIYSELNRKQSREQPSPEKKPRPQAAPQQHEVARSPREPEKGVKGAVKGWLRRQIDEEQSLTLPRAYLAPGRKVRLQIRQGLSEELRTVEITLPPDFTIGKPLRLKGLGKRVGPWQGDLYLTIYNE